MILPLSMFVCVTAAAVALLLLAPLLAEWKRGKIRRRLKEAFHAKGADESHKTLFKDRDVLNLSSAEEYALLTPDGRAWKRPTVAGLKKGLERLLLTADVPMPPGRFLLLTLTTGLVLALAGAWFGRWPGGAAGFEAGVALPFVFLHAKRQARRQKLIHQLPKAFDLMARVIRAGQSVPQAFQAVGDALEEPIAGEFTRCQQQQNLGLPPEVVFPEMAKRSEIVELRIFVMAMLVQRQAGGNLSDVLERLAVLLRSRQRLRQQVRTLTAEGRLQGLALVVLPFVMFAAMFFINRPYAEILLQHVPLLCGTIALMLLGVVWIRSIVNFQG